MERCSTHLLRSLFSSITMVKWLQFVEALLTTAWWWACNNIPLQAWILSRHCCCDFHVSILILLLFFLFRNSGQGVILNILIFKMMCSSLTCEFTAKWMHLLKFWMILFDSWSDLPIIGFIMRLVMYIYSYCVIFWNLNWVFAYDT